MTSHAKAEVPKKRRFMQPALTRYGVLAGITMASLTGQETHQEIIITRHGFGKWK